MKLLTLFAKHFHIQVAVRFNPILRDFDRQFIGILTEIVNRLLETHTSDGLKASEMLTKMCGDNEPERANVQSVEVKVDASLIEQLRAGYTEMSALRMGK